VAMHVSEKRDGWSSLRSAAVYALSAGLWILLSDYVAALLFKDESSLTIASTVKGWLFVAVTATILFGLLERDRRISERLASEIREAQAQTSSILDSAPQAIMFIDADGVVTYANHAVEATFGRPAHELVGTHGLDIGWVYRDLQGEVIPPERLPGVTVARTGEPVHARVMRITTSDGVPRVVSMNAVPKMDEEGRQGALATYTDITETVDAQRRLEHVNRLYATLGEASQAIIGLAEGRDPLPEVCRIAVETGGFVMAWVGVPDQETHLVIPLASAGRVDGYFDGLGISILDEELGRGPTGTAIREGRTVVCNDIATDPLMRPWRDRAISSGYASSISVPLIRDGVAVGAFSGYAPEAGFFGPREIELLERLGGDVSFAMVFQERERERRHAETGLRRWAEIFENTQVGVVISEFGSPLISLCNPAFSTMHGYSTPEEIIGSPLAAMTAADEQGRHIDRRRDGIGNGHSHYEARHVRKDGSTFPVDIDLTIVYDDAGAPRYGIATVVDITDRKATEDELAQHREHLEDLVEERTQELERANADLTRATEAKSQFLANMSHELRTPLNSIIGFTGIMLQGMAGPLNEEQEKQLGMVHRSGRYLLSLINDVLDLSRIEAGRIRVEIESFDMRDALSAVEQTLAPLAREKGLGLAFEAPEGAVPVLSDRGKIQQILLNLGGNAIKFTQEGGVTFHVEARPDEVVVTVSDTGVGITGDEQAHIFDEFHQIARAAGDKTQGSGLGLTICRRLARVLGGDVTVSSAPGLGSTFTLSIPTTVPGGSGIAREGGIDLKGRAAMVVEDDPSSLALMTLYLEREGVDVVQVEDGAEALTIARERHPDVILLDISLPGMDGQQVLSRLKNDPETADIPVICVSAFGPEEYDSRGSAAQLLKPVSRDMLVGQMERVLKMRVGHNGRRPGSPDEGEAP
jgi:PAS domain S-box-containing protein